MRDDRRERVLKRIQRLPAEKLHALEVLLESLECGDLSPLSMTQAAANGSVSMSNDELPSVLTPASAVSSTSKSGDESPHSKDWPHAPVHRLSDHGTFIVTAATLHKQHLFRRPECLDLLESTLLRLAKQSGWQLEAWAVFSNHYHFVAHADAGAEDLKGVIKHLHGETARELNRMERTSERSVWHNFWDTELTFEKSYLARLNYVHQNAVRHGLVRRANQYRWCSAAWFERTATRAQVRTIYSFKTDKVRVIDDFEVV